MRIIDIESSYCLPRDREKEEQTANEYDVFIETYYNQCKTYWN